MSDEAGAHGETLLRDELLALKDGRSLAFAEWGRSDGLPVVLLHGTPDSHAFCPDNFPVDQTSSGMGVRLVTVSRPGYSLSTPHPGRTLLGWVDDLTELVDSLGIDRFGLIGISGGGPFAMACAVAMPRRVGALSLVSTGGPIDDVPGDLDVLPPDRRAIMELARANPDVAAEQLAEESRWLVETPEVMLDPAGWPEVDRWIVVDPALRALILRETREAGRNGALGHAWDLICFFRPWGFAPREIAVRTRVWHGELDTIVPARHFVYFAMTIPHAETKLWPGVGHTAMLRGRYWGDVLEALRADMS